MPTKRKCTLKVGAILKAKHLQIFTVIFDILSIWMWDLIVTVPDHCLSFYFRQSNNDRILRIFGYTEMIKTFLIMNILKIMC